MEKIVASIITIGDELLIGQVIDTNSAWMAQELNRAGIWVRHRLAVGDVWEDIWNALDEESGSSHIILITGGLGPTADDITKPLLTEYFGGKLVVDPGALENVKYIFSRVLQRPMIDRNLKQAEVPDVCTVIPNRRGTAPGMWFEKEGRIFVSMPGVPHEMKGMMTDAVLPSLTKRFSLPFIAHRTLLTAGIGESFLAEHISAFESALPPYIKLAYLPNYGMVRLRLTIRGEETVTPDPASQTSTSSTPASSTHDPASAASITTTASSNPNPSSGDSSPAASNNDPSSEASAPISEPSTTNPASQISTPASSTDPASPASITVPDPTTWQNQLNHQFDHLKALVAEWLVIDEDLSLQAAVGKILTQAGKTIGTAESCTGGYLAHLLTSIAGSSQYFMGSVVSYDNALKKTILGVSSDTLATDGAVSEATVRQMVQGALKVLGTDFVVATSGIMGPGGGSEEKPVGTVWIAVGNLQKIIAQKFSFRFDRQRNIELTSTNALNLLRKFILTGS